MSTHVNKSKSEKETKAFSNYEDKQINFNAIARLNVGGECDMKFPFAAKQNKIYIKPRLDIKITLPKPNCDLIDYSELDKCISKLLECSSKMKSYKNKSVTFSMRDMICNSSKEKVFLGVKTRRDVKKSRKKEKEEETINYSNTQNSSNNNTGNEANTARRVLFKII